MMTEYVLPPLPDLPAYSSEVFDREVKVVSETMAEQLMHDYARDAIELYQRRIEELESQLEAVGAGGVSSHRITSPSRGEEVVMREICPQCGHQFECFHNPYINKMRATQPAEPVKVSSDDERAAQGIPPYSPRHLTEEEWNRLTENGRKAWGKKPDEPEKEPPCET